MNASHEETMKGDHTMTYDVHNFEEEVVKRSYEIPVLVDFWAEWCGPCRMLGPTLEQLAQHSDGRWRLAKVDTEELADVARTYGIRSIPNVKLFIDGKPAAEFVGALPERQVKAWLDKNLPSEHRAQLAEAERLLHDGNFEAAIPRFEAVLAAEPDNQQAAAELARLLLFKDSQRALSLAERVYDPKYSELAEATRTIAHFEPYHRNSASLPEGDVRAAYHAAIEDLFARDFDHALDKFIDVIRTARHYDDDGSRKACIAIFKLLGEEHETTRKHRRNFSRALY